MKRFFLVLALVLFALAPVRALGGLASGSLTTLRS
jgi:hypothetical protein